MTQMAEERQEHNNKMKKMEAEMEQVFEMKVKEKRQKLKDSEADVSSWRHECIFLLQSSECISFLTALFSNGLPIVLGSSVILC